MDLRTQVCSQGKCTHVLAQGRYSTTSIPQAQHQALDDGFVGLIISCFNRDQKLQCTAFQSEPAQSQSASVALGAENEDPEIIEALKLSLEGECLISDPESECKELIELRWFGPLV